MNYYYSIEKILYKIIYKIFKPFLRNWYLKFCTPYIKLKNKLFYNNYKKSSEIVGDIDILKYEKICVFSHFDRNNQVADYVFHYLESLKELNCAIIFVSTCAVLDDYSIGKIKHLVAKIVLRRNIGWDFGSFYIGYEITKSYSHHKLLIFANDSVYGPLHPLQNLISMMDDNQCDVGGVTDSYECGYHLQSYFLMFSSKVFSNSIFDNFFKNFSFSNNKTFVVHKYEIGLSRLLINNGSKLKALCNYLEVANKFFLKTFHYYPHKLNKEWSEFCNPTHAFWHILIEDFKCPLIKKDLLLNNPAGIINFFLWPEVIKNTEFDISLIESHLKQINIGIGNYL